MPVNYRNLRIEINRQAPTAIYRKVKPLMMAEFEARKATMLQDFDAHPVTRALEAGTANPRAQDGLISTSNGGNLYSLVGFNAGEAPAAVVRDILEKDVRLNISQTTREVKTNTIIFKTPVRMPTLADLNEKVANRLPLEWTSRSFTDLIERGVTGFGHYLYNNLRHLKGSRSGPAIQLDPKLRGGSAPALKWTSAILASFRNLIAGKRSR